MGLKPAQLKDTNWSFKEKVNRWGFPAMVFSYGGNSPTGKYSRCGVVWELQSRFVSLVHEGKAESSSQSQEYCANIAESISLEGQAPQKVEFIPDSSISLVKWPELSLQTQLPENYLSWNSYNRIEADPIVALRSKDSLIFAYYYANQINPVGIEALDLIQAYINPLGLDVYDNKKTVLKRNRQAAGLEYELSGESSIYRNKVYKGRFILKDSTVQFILTWFDVKNEKDALPHSKKLLKSIQAHTHQSSIAKSEQIRSAHLLNILGLLRQKSGRHLLAISLYEKAQQLDPENPLYLLNAGFLYQVKKMHAPGIRYLSKYESVIESDGLLAHLLGAMHESLRNWGHALDWYSYAYRFIPWNEYLRIDISDALWALGYKRQSLEVVKDLYDQKPGLRLGVYLAQTYMGRDRWDEGIALLFELKEKFKISKELAEFLVHGLIHQERYEEALAINKEAEGTFGVTGKSLLARGKCQFYLKQFQAALASFNEAEKYIPHHEEVLSFKAATQTLLGKGDNTPLRKEIKPVFPIHKFAEIHSKVLEKPELYKDYPAAVHFRKKAVSFNKDKPWKITEEMLVKITQVSGTSLFSEFVFSFIPGYDRLFINHLAILDSNGKLKRKASIKDFYVTSEIGQEATRETQLAHIGVKELAPGDFIHIQMTRSAIKKSQYFPFVNHRSARTIPVGTDILQVHADTAKLQYESFGGMDAVATADGLIWTEKQPLILREEKYMPHYREVGSGVLLGQKGNWRAVGRNYQNLIKRVVKNSLPVREKAREIKGNQFKMQKIIDSMVFWVRHQVRYKYIPFGGHSIIPAYSLETMRRRWGDCKDQALLLHEMLKAINIPSYLTLINNKEPISPELATIQQFNHMILYIPGSDLWQEQYIDLTEPVGSPRIISYHLENKYALIVDGENSRLVQTPQVTGSRENINRMKHQISIREDGSADLKDHLVLKGKAAAILREQFSELSQIGRVDALKAILSKDLPDVIVSNVEFVNMIEYEKPLEIIAYYKLKQFVNMNQENIQFKLPNIWENAFMNIPDSRNRLHPVQLPHELSFEMKVNLKIPDQWKIMEVSPWNEQMGRSEYTQAAFMADRTDNTMQLQGEWKTNAVYASAKEYHVLYEEWQKILKNTAPVIQLRKVN